MMQTRAAVLRSGGPVDGPPPFDALAIETLELVEPGPGEVLVDIAAACICHSDLSVLTGHRPRPLPMVLGHEASGVVAAVGPGVRRVSPGQHVLLTYVPACGRCRACVSGTPALCPDGNRANAEGRLLTGRRPFSDATGSALNQHLGLSAFSQRTVVAEESLLALDERVPLQLAALFGCAILTGVGAVVNTAKVPPGASVAIVGLGGVGLSAVMGATLAGAAETVAIDVRGDTFELARRLGATRTVLADGGFAEAVREHTAGGADYAFDTTGHAPALAEAYAATRPGGTTVVVGLAEPNARVEVSPADLVVTERVVRGSYMGTTVPARDVRWLTDLYLSGRLPLEDLIGERLALEDVPEAFRRLHGGVNGRQLVEIDA